MAHICFIYLEVLPFISYQYTSKIGRWLEISDINTPGIKDSCGLLTQILSTQKYKPHSPKIVSSIFSTKLFATYFSNKITKLYFNLQSNPSATPIHLPPPSPLLSSPLLPLPHYKNYQLYVPVIQFILSSWSHPYNGSHVHIRYNISNHSIHYKSLPSYWHLSPSSKIITRQSTSQKTLS